ncbi:MAG: pyridoxal-5-phosphate-dependent protein subunit beta [Micavibrio sp.]|nr:pyridoxal-5-phosphate-dependent protein subunit beta [Micavibrio sp.]
MKASTPAPELSSSILDAIGNTPLLSIGDGVFAKAEFLNPSGSIKARMAKFLIEKAEDEGLLKPGMTIIESTSGNTGNALSMVAAAKGYKMIVCIPEGYTNERTLISRGFGATVKYMGYFHVNEAKDYAIRQGQKEGFYCPAQFDSEWNVEENREWLGREVIEQINKSNIKIDAIVQGVGTGGTLIGVAQALKEWHNPDLKVFAMEPSESPTLTSGIVETHRIEGINDGFVPSIYERHRDLVDDVIQIDGEDAIEACKSLASNKGLFVGPSSGGNYLAAQKIKQKYPEMGNVLTFLCDKAEKYLSILYR